MFQVKLDDYVLYDYRLDDLEHEDMTIYNAKISKEANKTGSFNFKIADTHRFFNHIHKMKSIVKVYQRGSLIFRGRILEDTQGFNKVKTVDCEGELAFLLDSIYRPFNLTGKTVSLKEFFTDLITNHNSQVKDHQKFILGEIEVEDPNEKVNFSSETALKTWDIISDRIIKTYGGYLYITYDENEMPVINYYKEPPYTSLQSIEYGVNLLDISKLISAENIATACIPYGAVINEETKERLTIESVNDGLDYLINEEKAEEFGIIYAKPEDVTFDNVTTAATLKAKAEEFLNDNVMLSETIELKAVDLADGKEIYNFKFLDNIRLISLPHGFNNVVYILKKLDLDLFNLAGTTIVLGETKKTLTDSSLTNYNKANTIIKSIENIASNYTTNEKVTSIVSEEIGNSTVIDQKSQEIVLQALLDYVKTTDYNTFKETNSSELQVLAEQIIANFTTTTSSIESVDGDLQQKYEELKSWIRGYQNETGQPVVELGEAQSTIKLKLENDEIYFDVNGVKRFYLTAEGKIVFKNAVFEETTEINGFAFVPRSNGNLSFVRVKEG